MGYFEVTLETTPREIAIDCPINVANMSVPRPTVPPKSHPAINTVPSMPKRTLPIRIPDLLWRAVINPSRGPGPRPQVIYKLEPIPTIEIPTKQYRIPKR
jgi:hypothetical protein